MEDIHADAMAVQTPVAAIGMRGARGNKVAGVALKQFGRRRRRVDYFNRTNMICCLRGD